MAVFWTLAALMTAVALAFVLVPMLRARPAAAPSATDANLEILRGQRREIEADIASGTLPAEAREEAIADLMGRAQDDLSAPVPVAPPRSRPWLAAGIVAVAVPAIAFGLYAAVGSPAASDSRAVAALRAPGDEQQIVAMVENLARKVRERPDDAQGWALLARSMAALGRFKEAAEAYGRLAKLVPRDAQVLADYADALGMAQGRTLEGKPYELVKEALKIDPKNMKALALAGTAALDAGDFAAADAHWRNLAAQLPPGSPEEAQVRSILDEIRQRALASGKAVPAAPFAPSPPKLAKAPGPAASTVTGSITLAPEIASRVSGGETLFIFARSEGGPRVPLAVVRASARELPMKFALDDSQAMAPGVNLSSAQSVRIEARVSRSGNAAPQPGDLAGTSAVVKPGARDVKIVIDKVVP
jgi:cytochrome c-type biogenesis protein CcmH